MYSQGYSQIEVIPGPILFEWEHVGFILAALVKNFAHSTDSYEYYYNQLLCQCSFKRTGDNHCFCSIRIQLETELERRKELGFNFQQILQRQKANLQEDEEAREAHLVAFEASLREAVRVLKGFNENKGKGDNIGDFNDQLEHR